MSSNSNLRTWLDRDLEKHNNQNDITPDFKEAYYRYHILSNHMLSKAKVMEMKEILLKNSKKFIEKYTVNDDIIDQSIYTYKNFLDYHEHKFFEYDLPIKKIK